jgi:membrane protein involved in colicin uptake
VKPDEVAVFRPRVTVAAGKKPAHGKSLVKGDEPPARLAEHRKEREREHRQKGNQAEISAKDVQEQPPALATREVKIPQQDAQRQRDQARQDAVKEQTKQQVKQQDQERLEREKHPVNDKAKLDPQRERRDSDAQAQADKRAKDAREARENAKEKARNKGKNKGKKDPNASPTPPPAGDKE